MLVGDRDALRAVHLLHLRDQEALDRVHALDLQQVLRVERAFGQRMPGEHLVPGLDPQPGRVGHLVLAHVHVLEVEGERVPALGDPSG